MRLLRLSRFWLGVAFLALAPIAANAATLSALATFGGGDGWRAPNEVLAGDSAGTTGTPTPGAYNYLQTGRLERGLAYNPVTGNLVLVSRGTAGNGIRLLNGMTGVDVGSLNQGAGIISGGTFTTNMVGVASTGEIYVGNLTTNASVAGSAFKIYQWSSEGAAAPTVFHNSAIAGFSGTPRLGDTLDVIGGGAGTTLAAGASGSVGYAVFNNLGVANSVPSFVPATPTAGDFRLGMTFGPTANDVLGKQTSQNLEVTSYLGSLGTSLASAALTSLGEAAMDFAVIKGRPFLAVLDINNSNVRVYDVSSPAAPFVVASGTTTSGTLSANTDGTGSVKWGAIGNDGTATLYAMSTNQGIQAFQVTGLPEPTSALLLGLGSVMLTGWCRRVRS